MAQQKKKNVIGWRVITAAGLAAGKSGTGAVYQFSGGLTYSGWFGGAGIGYNKYTFNSFPLVADLRRSFGKQQLVFVYVNPGYAIPGKFKMNFNDGRPSDDNLEGGFYMEGGLGYRLPFSKWHHLSLSGGYTSKSMVHHRTIIIPCDSPDCIRQERQEYTYRYRFGLLTARLSWEWGR
jgi:hypothetical protein